jgi:hypothetical protein
VATRRRALSKYMLQIFFGWEKVEETVAPFRKKKGKRKIKKRPLELLIKSTKKGTPRKN